MMIPNDAGGSDLHTSYLTNSRPGCKLFGVEGNQMAYYSDNDSNPDYLDPVLEAEAAVDDEENAYWEARAAQAEYDLSFNDPAVYDFGEPVPVQVEQEVA